MPYPSTPLTGTVSPSPAFDLALSPTALYKPSHRTAPPAVSCLRNARSPISSSTNRGGPLSPLRHHLISISSNAKTGGEGYFSSVYEGSTRAPGYTPMGFPSPKGNALRGSVFGGAQWAELFGLGINVHENTTNLGPCSISGVMDLTINSGEEDGGRAPALKGLRISDLPPFVMSRDGTGGSSASGSDESETSERTVVSSDVDGSGGAEEIAVAGWRMKRQRTATPFPKETERDEWLDEAQD